ncbi:MAG: glycosyltransferase family 2 protein [Rhodothermia bacterium]|nr:glycosyltransferase family 2 protein [Rhodothermia bacterium]
MSPSDRSAHPRVSIIVVSWNAVDLLREFMPTVAATDYPDFEIILADNASEDGSAQWVQNNLPDIRIVRHDRNYAFCGGNNRAYPYATGEYVVFLNNDVKVEPDWLRPLVKQMESDKSIAAIQPKVLSYRQQDRFEYAGAAGGFLDRFGYPFARGRIFFKTEIDRGQYDDFRDVFWATGAAMMIRRSAVDEVGLFDEAFVMHMEEIDLCWRLHRAGLRVAVEPQSVVYHLGAASLAETSPRKAYLNFRNNLLTLYKNLPPTTWRRVAPARAVLDSIAMLRTLLLGRPQESAAIARAYRDAMRMRGQYSDQRPTEETTGLLYGRSIVVDYFVRRRRLFKRLPKRHLPLFRNPG